MPTSKEDEVTRKKLGDIIVGYAFASPRNQNLKAAVDDAMQLILAREEAAVKEALDWVRDNSADYNKYKTKKEISEAYHAAKRGTNFPVSLDPRPPFQPQTTMKDKEE